MKKNMTQNDWFRTITFIGILSFAATSEDSTRAFGIIFAGAALMIMFGMSKQKNRGV